MVWNRLSTGFWSPVEVGAAIGGGRSSDWWKTPRPTVAVQSRLVERDHGSIRRLDAEHLGIESRIRFLHVWTLSPEDFQLIGWPPTIHSVPVTTCTGTTRTPAGVPWNLEVDSSTDTFAITSAQHLTYGSTGTVALVSEAWEIVGVAAASGVATAVPGQQEACDVVWMNTADGRTGLWTCNPTANSQVDGLSYIESNGTEMQVVSGYELVGIGQQFFSLAQYYAALWEP